LQAQALTKVQIPGLSRSALFKAVDACLARIGTSYIDLFQIHRYDPATPLEETMKALHDLVQAGKVLYIGASSMWATQFAQMQFIAEKNGWTKFISMQNYYNLCYREEEREMNRFCKETGVGIINWSPLFSGRLARPVGYNESMRSKKPTPHDNGLTEADENIIRRVEQLAARKGWKMSQVALLWLRNKGTVPIVGLNSVNRIDEACDIRGKSLTNEEVKYLEEPYLPKSVAGHL
jgi:aryl-alcohol dehydrogenase-like predicted oxidoreductase